MIYSYDKVYLRIAQRVLGEMLNYAVYDCGYELNEYYRLFTESSYSAVSYTHLTLPTNSLV